MITFTYQELLTYSALLAGTFSLTYGLASLFEDYLRKCKSKENARKAQEAEYIRAVTEENETLKADMKAAMFRELGYLNERDVASRRIKFLGEELAFDGKETRVLNRQ